MIRKNRYKRINIFLVSILVLLFCCKPVTKELSKIELTSIIENRISDFEKVLMADDLEARMDYYDSEASVSPDGFPVIQGKENIRNFLSKGMKMAKFSKLDLRTNYINGNKDYIYQMGLMDSEIVVYDSLYFDNSSKFFYLWKLQDDGLYRIVAEVTSSKDEDDD